MSSHDRSTGESPPALVVMAAGMGSRFGGMKQLASVGPHGEPMIAYAVHDALRAGFGRIVFVIRRDMESAFRERVGRFVEERADTAYAFQEMDRLPNGFNVPKGRAKPWGTGHALLSCRDAVRGAFAAINADDFYGPESYRVLCDYLKTAADGPDGYDYCMVGFTLRNTLSDHGPVSRGICRATPDGLLTELVERTRVLERDGVVTTEEADGRRVELPDETVVSLNMWGFTPGLFGELETRFARFLRDSGADPTAEFFIPEVVGELVREGKARVRVLPTSERWYGVTYRDDVPILRDALQRMTREGTYPEKLWDLRD